jgi:uncharacterized membrane protein YphA (DoxX/SURF4 family)
MKPSWKRTSLDALAVLLRWLVGAYFIYMGLSKALHPVGFLKLVREYELVSSALLLNSIAAALPWFEVFCGVLLVLGVAVRGSALVLACMLVPFTLVVAKRALAISQAKAIAFCLVRFDCGCGSGEVLICNKLIENCALTLACGWLVTGAGRRLAARFSLLAEPRTSGNESEDSTSRASDASGPLMAG